MKIIQPLLIATLVLVACGVADIAQAQAPKGGYLTPDGEWAQLRQKPADNAPARARLYYGQKVLWKPSGTDGWNLCKEYKGKAQGYIQASMISEKRPAPLKMDANTKKGYDKMAGQVKTEAVSTAAVRLLDKKAKGFAKRKLSEEEAAKIIHDLGFVEAKIAGAPTDFPEIEPIYPNKDKRTKDAQGFIGGAS